MPVSRAQLLGGLGTAGRSDSAKTRPSLSLKDLSDDVREKLAASQAAAAAGGSNNSEGRPGEAAFDWQVRLSKGGALLLLLMHCLQIRGISAQGPDQFRQPLGWCNVPVLAVRCSAGAAIQTVLWRLSRGCSKQAATPRHILWLSEGRALVCIVSAAPDWRTQAFRGI